MTKIFFELLSIITIVLFVSCSKSYDSIDTVITTDTDGIDTVRTEQEKEMLPKDNVIEIPFKEKDGVKYISVKINGGPVFDMIFDTGASTTYISLAEIQYLLQKGLVSWDDYQESIDASYADGVVKENMVFNIKEIVVGNDSKNNLKYENVLVTVSSSTNSPLLLGNEVLNRENSITIDNDKQVIRIEKQ